MSDTIGDYKFLDELEWRIVYTDRAFNEGKIVKTNLSEPKYKIPFTQDELKILILPDDYTRRNALNDSYIRDWLFEDPAELPIIATISECLQF